MIRPYRQRQPGDLLTASDWNEVQRQHRLALRDHQHGGGIDALPLSADSFDAGSSLSVHTVELERQLRVGAEDWSPVFDGLPPEGRITPGQNLRVAGRFTVRGRLHWQRSTRPGEPLRAWATLSGKAPSSVLLSLSLSGPALYLIELRLRGVGSPMIRLGLRREGAEILSFQHAAATQHGSVQTVVQVGAAPTLLDLSGNGSAMMNLELRATPLWGGARA